MNNEKEFYETRRFIVANLIEEAIRRQRTNRDLEAAVAKAVEGMRLHTNTLPDVVSSKVTTALNSAIAETKNSLLKDFRQAHEMANHAANEYKKAFTWALWVFLGSALMGTCAIYFGIWLIQPSTNEINDLKQEVVALREEMALLRQNGTQQGTTIQKTQPKKNANARQ